MISIARHRAIDVLRQRKELVLAPMDEGEDWLERVAGPGDGEADLEDRDRLRHCLQRLEEPQRSCILLAYCDGYSRDELGRRAMSAGEHDQDLAGTAGWPCCGPAWRRHDLRKRPPKPR